MTTSETTLLIVMPDEPLDALASRIAMTTAATVDLMIPDGMTLLHSASAWQSLRSAAMTAGSELVAISSDAATIAAAQQAGVSVMGVQGSHITAPTSPSAPPVHPPSSSAAELPAWLIAAIKQPVTPTAAAPAPSRAAHDAPTLPPYPVARASVTPAPPPDTADMSADDLDFFSALDDFDSMNDSSAGGGTAATADGGDDALAAQLDGLNDAFAEPPAHRTAAPPPPRRIRPEDIELTADEVQRARATGKRSAEPVPRKPRRREELPSLDELYAEQQRGGKPSKRRTGMLAEPEPQRERNPILIGLLIALLLAAGLFLLFSLFGGRLFGGRVNVQVTLPTPPTETVDLGDVPIFITQPGAEDTGTAVFAVPIQENVSFTTAGQVTDQTFVPGAAAQGNVTIFSQNSQAIGFAAGTEFIARNPKGNEVRFVNESGFTVPAASTERRGAQIITTLGEVTVAVVARNPGSAGNVEGNTVFQIVPPGQAPIAVNSGGVFDVTHGPLGGGNEQPVRIVKEQDVQGTLSAGLTGLYNTARQSLSVQAQAAGLDLAATTVVPTAEQLSQGIGFQLQSQPEIGQPTDFESGLFQVTVAGNFSALATPIGQPLQDQLQRVLTNQLDSEQRIPWGMAPAITDWRWDGSRLMVTAILQPVPLTPELTEEQRREIRSALRGRSRAEAETILQDYIRRNWIGAYILPPNVDVMPTRDTQIDLVVVGQNPLQ